MTTITMHSDRRLGVRLRNQPSSSSTTSSSSSSEGFKRCDSISLGKRRKMSVPLQQQQPKTTMKRMLSYYYYSFAVIVIILLWTSPATAQTTTTTTVIGQTTVTINTGGLTSSPRDETVTATTSTVSAAAPDTGSTSSSSSSGTDSLHVHPQQGGVQSVTTGTTTRGRQAVEGMEVKRRVRVRPFLINLLKTPGPLQPYEYDELYGIIQQLLNEHIAEMTNELALQDLALLQQQSQETTTTTTSSTTSSMSVDTSEYLSLTYVLLTDIDGVYAEPEHITTLTMGEGVAAFYAPGADVPSEDLVDDWVRDAIDTELVGKLSHTKYGYVQQATYVSLMNKNENENPDEDDTDIDDKDVSEVVSNATPQEAATNGTNQAMSVGLVAGVACAGALTLVIIGFLVGKQRQKAVMDYASAEGGGGVGGGVDDGHLVLDSGRGGGRGSGSSRSHSPRKAIPPGMTCSLDDDDDLDDDEEEQTNNSIQRRITDMTPVTAATIAVARATSELECRSMAEMSDSDWTVSTEAGDSAALKSVGGGVGNFAGSFPRRGGGGGGMAVVPAMVTAESFERDRQVNLRKDMLTSPWSGRMPSIRTAQQESVLQPSHFTASQERRLRQTTNMDFDQESSSAWNSSSLGRMCGDDDVVSGGGGGGSGDAPFIFRPHTEDVGEEIFIMQDSGGQRHTEIL